MVIEVRKITYLKSTCKSLESYEKNVRTRLIESLEAIYEIKSQLIKIRSEMGISQIQLAEMTGTKQSAISRLESGDYNPSIEFLSKIASALGKELHVEIR
jgi:predicted transcriptional regulator